MKDIDVSKRLVRGALGQVEEAGKGQNIHSAENSLERKTEEVLPGWTKNRPNIRIKLINRRQREKKQNFEF